ncbi:MAG: RNA 2',3'-cyclic phosphodiesterase [Phycisphaerales bacterium]|nr:RNA 2',3'-cyclic phosphodiesterase [Phycisphaerales bacterium]
MRCFIAVDLDADWRRAIARLLPSTRGAGGGPKWVAADSLHVTLWFLGEIADAAVPALSDALAQAAQRVEPFELALAGAGCFPPRDRARVLWLGIEDPAAGCGRWIAAAAPLLAPLGFAPESRPFHAHLTLARSRNPAGDDALRQAADQLRPPAVSTMRVSEITLFESVLGPRGAEYRPLARFGLGGAAGGG